MLYLSGHLCISECERPELIVLHTETKAGLGKAASFFFFFGVVFKQEAARDLKEDGHFN